ncbi:thioredoxin-like 4, chloroplastic [Amaranthus tricolor]|uniref:thioredoxin-like 4, chloroplastic n=1 Tax=Amaranthus tricolor TaxID=29722 RepID=UPI00258ADB8F|nr:thioredoxin-like 4, chloroplastic [Amaranthus tricolor]XP_057516018.1 thioredoxin-like 4, chloroplastic [Amaranthus tricolor]
MSTMSSTLGGCCKSPIHLGGYCRGQLVFRTSLMPIFRTRNPMIISKGILSLGSLINDSSVRKQSLMSVAGENGGDLLEEDEDDELCPVECVREFKTDDEFLKILEKAKTTNALVVVDFYRNSCGSCKYIEQGFAKLCKASGDDDVPVIFLKHNVIDEYDEQSEVADRLRIKTVPLFHFYKNGVLLEAFPTRDKERITKAIYKYMSCSSQESPS